MCFDHVCFRCVFHCFQVYYVWFKSLQRGRPCLISKLGPQGLSNVCEFRRLEVESVGNDIEDVINKQEGPTKFQMNIMMLGFLACSMLGLWYYDTQDSRNGNPEIWKIPEEKKSLHNLNPAADTSVCFHLETTRAKRVSGPVLVC